MADMGVYGTSYINLSILRENETDSSMLSRVIAKAVLYQKSFVFLAKSIYKMKSHGPATYVQIKS
jgi:hypothetical protein